VGLLFSRHCPCCDQSRAQLREEQRRAHDLELKLCKAETLAQVHRLEVERLEQRLASKDTIPIGGGFAQLLSHQQTVEEKPATDAPDFAQRIDEIFGGGIDLTEFVRRQELHRQERITGLEAERSAVRKELQQIP
jgi:hypothetical protein